MFFSCSLLLLLFDDGDCEDDLLLLLLVLVSLDDSILSADFFVLVFDGFSSFGVVIFNLRFALLGFTVFVFVTVAGFFFLLFVLFLTVCSSFNHQSSSSFFLLLLLYDIDLVEEEDYESDIDFIADDGGIGVILLSKKTSFLF